MKYIITALVVLILVVAGFLFLNAQPNGPVVIGPETDGETETESMTVIAEGLEIPWDIAFLPDNSLLVSERPGRLLKITDGTKTPIHFESEVKKGGEGGLLGVLLHPQFAQNQFVYLYLSSSQAGENINRVERYRLESDALVDKAIIVDKIPGALYHDGGRMEFGPDGLLYVTTGDATRAQLAQDKTSLGGKILRINDDGSMAAGNPFGTRVYSYGHRNPQGLAWDSEGRLWQTEHGPTGDQGLCCRDEINLIVAGGNYGWPTIAGDNTKDGMQAPALQSGMDVWAPASLAYLSGSLFFGGLRGEALYEAVLDGEKIVELKEHFKNQFGRIRTVRVGPDNMLYITTSNADGRGSGDKDVLMRINPAAL